MVVVTGVALWRLQATSRGIETLSAEHMATLSVEAVFRLALPDGSRTSLAMSVETPCEAPAPTATPTPKLVPRTRASPSVVPARRTGTDDWAEF